MGIQSPAPSSTPPPWPTLETGVSGLVMELQRDVVEKSFVIINLATTLITRVWEQESLNKPLNHSPLILTFQTTCVCVCVCVCAGRRKHATVVDGFVNYTISGYIHVN